jgi:hypothetical protein
METTTLLNYPEPNALEGCLTECGSEAVEYRMSPTLCYGHRLAGLIQPLL